MQASWTSELSRPYVTAMPWWFRTPGICRAWRGGRSRISERYNCSSFYSTLTKSRKNPQTVQSRRHNGPVIERLYKHDIANCITHPTVLACTEEQRGYARCRRRSNPDALI